MTQALEDLLEALEDIDDATREDAAKALAAIADPRSLDALIAPAQTNTGPSARMQDLRLPSSAAHRSSKP